MVVGLSSQYADLGLLVRIHGLPVSTRFAMMAKPVLRSSVSSGRSRSTPRMRLVSLRASNLGSTPGTGMSGLAKISGIQSKKISVTSLTL